MTFKPATWYPIAAALSIINVVAVWFVFVAGPPGPLHATTHATLAVAFGLWAQRLRQRLRPRSDGSELAAGLEALEVEVSTLRQELGEAQERLDFAERLLAQRPEPQRVDQPKPPRGPEG